MEKIVLGFWDFQRAAGSIAFLMDTSFLLSYNAGNMDEPGVSSASSFFCLNTDDAFLMIRLHL